MSKRKLTPAPAAINSDEELDEGQAVLKKNSLATATYRAAATAALKALEIAPKPLAAELDAESLGENVPWFMRASKELWLEMLNYWNHAERRYNISYTRLAEIASCSLLPFLLFHDATYQTWKGCIDARVCQKNPSRPQAIKYNFVISYLHKRKYSGVQEPVYGGLLAYLNFFGPGYCQHCGFYPDFTARTLLNNDYIPISAFRRMTKQETSRFTSYDDKLLYPQEPGKPNPDWVTNMLYIRAGISKLYCCANPKCGVVLNQQVCSFPTSAIFTACISRARKKHVWEELENDLVDPQKQVIPGVFRYCVHCGVLDHLEDEDDSEACAFCDGDASGNCCCVPCELCKKLPTACKCLVCAVCHRCQNPKCGSVCKANLCHGHESSSSSSSSSSSDESSSESSSASTSTSDSDSD